MNDLELNSELEITKDNICNFVSAKLKEINDLWKISDKDWKKLPDDKKQEYYKIDSSISKEVSENLINVFNLNTFEIGEFGNLKSKNLDLSITLHLENFEIERGIFETQEYKYHNIEFKKNKFEENLLDFFENRLKWFKLNDGVPNYKAL